MASKAKAGLKAASKVIKDVKSNENKIIIPKEKSIFNIVNGLRYYGLGSKITRYIIF
jgi:hypothetical protein